MSALDDDKIYTGKVARINGRVDQASQTIKAFIEVKDSSLREGMYLEANLDAKEETNAIEIDRGLLFGRGQDFRGTGYHFRYDRCKARILYR